MPRKAPPKLHKYERVTLAVGFPVYTAMQHRHRGHLRVLGGWVAFSDGMYWGWPSDMGAPYVSPSLADVTASLEADLRSHPV